MSIVTIAFAEQNLHLECRELRSRERLGEATEVELVLFAAEPVELGAVLGRACAITLATPYGERTIRGVVMRFVAVATSQQATGRRYRATVRSAFATLALRRRTRVFQHLTVPDIIRKILADGAYHAGDIATALAEKHAPREYVVQYQETDAAFIRRLSEEDGLYFRFGAGDLAETFLIEDSSPLAPNALGAPLVLADRTERNGPVPIAFSCRASLRRRPGKVTIRAYNPDTPARCLEGAATAGNDVERGVEVYEAPGRFSASAEGSLEATRRLESVRADAEVVTFETTAVALAPGSAVTLACGPRYVGTARPEGDHLVVAVTCGWRFGETDLEIAVEAIPLATPFRLPRTTRRPRIHGVHTAIVTGARGEEIHVDETGRVRVSFPWDREGPADDRSSLPVRVMQPNLPGSMLLPRVGWEVMVAFEDGDPDRPYVLGRVWNAKFPPPHGLPQNKTVTSLGTYSSPGGAGENSIRFDDAAGRQAFVISAAHGKTVMVANNMVTQTVKNESHVVSGSQTRTVGGNEKVSVAQAYRVMAGSQSTSVGATQNIFVKGKMSVGVGSETVVVGGALLEQVGNPVTGAKNLATAAALAGAGAMGKAGAVFAAGAGLAKGAIEGAAQGGAAGAATAVGMGAIGMAAGMVPGGDALLGVVMGSGRVEPWKEGGPPPGEQAPGGGASGASDAAGAEGPGPGHRNTTVHGAMSELIGAAYSALSPGSVSSTTAGASLLLVGASHTTKTASYHAKTLGGSTETVGSLRILSRGGLSRDVTGALSTSIAGALTSEAGGVHLVKAGAALTFKIGGSLTMKGSKITFVCGGSKLSISPSGVLLKAGRITVTGSSKQSGMTSHS